ncbi:MAG TPA: hypothetical protein PLL59_06205 [Chitinophagales bacterium]|nr:hypothetical protein [Chitinophagales bacterium]
MQKFYLLLYVAFFMSGSHLFAQEEIYDSPIRIMDTLERNPDSKKGKEKPDKIDVADDAKTALEKKKEMLNRLRIGGNFGLQFGSYTYINLSPTLGFMAVKKRLEVGAGPIFIYQRFRYTNFTSYNFFVYGADVYSHGFLYKGLYLEARYDAVNKPSYYNLDKRLWVHHLLLGAGYAVEVGKVGVFNISLMYNVLDNQESIYQGTFSDKFPLILNMGFGFGVGGN